MIQNLAVQIVHFVDQHQPGWVECEFADAEGRKHLFTDKVPVFTREDLWTDSAHPRLGSMPCEVLARWRDSSGRELVRISTANPLGDESAEGLSEFVVLSSQLSP